MKNQLDAIGKLTEEYYKILLSNQRIALIQKEIEKENIHLLKLEAGVEKEYYDVVEIENSTMRQLFTGILKSVDDQLEKERQEYLHAVLRYKECEKLIELLGYELKVLQEKSRNEKIVLSAINDQMNLIDGNELYASSPLFYEFKVINTEIKQLHRLDIESKEALDVVNQIKGHFSKMISLLVRAQEVSNWGDYYHERKRREKEQKGYVDQAHSHFYYIKKLLIFLQKELQDVIEFQEIFKRTATYVHGLNMGYYQDLIADWIKDSNLLETMSNTMEASNLFVDLKLHLEKIIRKTEQEKLFQQKRRNQLIQKIMDFQ